MKNLNATSIREFCAQNAIYIVLVALIVGIAIYDSQFLSVTTIRDILLQSSTRAIIALGAAFVLITGGRRSLGGPRGGTDGGAVGLHAANAGLSAPLLSGSA